MNNIIQEILFQMQSGKMSLEDGKREIELLKNERKYSQFILHRSISEEMSTQDNPHKVCYLYINETNDRNLDAYLNEKCLTCENVFLHVENSNQMTFDNNKISFDFSDEKHFDKVQEHIRDKYDNYLLHVLHFIAVDNEKVLDAGVEKHGLFMVLFAKYFAYSFARKGIKYQMFYNGNAPEIVAAVEAIAASGSSINREIDAFQSQIILTEQFNQVDNLYDLYLKEINAKIDSSLIVYNKNKRLQYKLEETDLVKGSAQSFPSGNYVIFGGMGGIGKQVVKELVKSSDIKVIIVGRREKNHAIEQFASQMSNFENQVVYFPCDLLSKESVNTLFDRITDDFGNVDYVLHSAGVVEDSFVMNKTEESYKRVVSTKTLGTMNILDSLEGRGVKKIIFFTSTSGVFGNEGQCDYAYANMFIDNMCLSKKYRNKCLSISWPLWDIDGMNMPEEQKNMLFRRFGLVPMPPRVGMQVLKDLFEHSDGNQILLFGDKAKLTELVKTCWNIEGRDTSSIDDKESNSDSNVNNEEVLKKIKEHVSSVIEDVVGLARGQLKPNQLIQNIGMDSVMIAEAITKLQSGFGTISKTLFFEYRTVEKVAEYLMNHCDIRSFQKPVLNVDNEEQLSGELEEKINRVLKRIICEVTGLQNNDLSDTKSFRDLGTDSVMIAEINSKMEEVFGPLPKTIMFEYNSVGELTEYMIRNKLTVISEFENQNVVDDFSESIDACLNDKDLCEKCSEKDPNGDIAIVGLAGKYPMAKDVDEFWQNLLEGKDCISEIPKSRWDCEPYQKHDGDEEWWKSTYKWGGFIDDIDKFDALSFGIAPNDAKMMDPHQRIFAETVWQALEDAGYNKDRLKERHVGVYTGAMWSNYQLYGVEDAYHGEMVCYDSSLCSISNRISYLFDFNGPSMTIDTMCSSSLVAIHLACQHLLNGDINVAIAGGVNLSLHPYKYIQLTKGGFLAKDGRCRAFGANASGYVPGEGSGVVVLKKLKDAENDNDYIYGVIKATSVNHNGNGIGYNVPDPIQQSNVIEAALTTAKVDPRTISYVEAHGTGTSVGDPIEIAGLKRIFGHFGKEKFCSIGSVKSNIGHLEAAAGMASITKVLLQMKNRKLVPSLHADVLNPNLNLEQTPFVIQRDVEEWKSNDGLLRAGISAFGAGGTNAHIIVEEYPKREKADYTVEPENYHVFVLSGNNKDIVKNYAESILGSIRSQKTHNIEERIAFTMQLSRNHMAERIAFIYQNTDELIRKIESYLYREFDGNDILTGHVVKAQINYKEISVDYHRRNDYNYLSKVAREWVKGAKIHWEELYSGEHIDMIKLPHYPFEKNTYWLPKRQSEIEKAFSNMSNGSEVKDNGLIDLYGVNWIEEKNSTTLKHSNSKLLLILNRENLETIHKMDLQGQFENVYYAIAGEPNGNWGDIVVDINDENGFAELCKYFDNNKILPDYVLDMSECTEDDQTEPTPHGKIKFMQWLIRCKQGKSLSYLHVTRNIQSGKSKKGVIFSAFIENLQGEYSNIRCKHIDCIDNIDIQNLVFWCFNESFADNRVVYKRNVRKIREYHKITDEVINTTSKLESDVAYVVVGGTRGIGAQIALQLVGQGVKKIAIIGNSPLDSPEKKKLISDLESSGAKVLVYTGGVADYYGLREFLQSVETEFGEIHTVFHCAGCYSKENFAFVYKERSEIDYVLEPKVIGTENLFNAISDISVKNVVLFSSISTITPKLSKGLSDYVAGNKVLDMFTSYYERNSSTRVITILWPNWIGVGFGAPETKEYIETGMLSFGPDDGIKLLFSIINSNVSGTIIPIKHVAEFDISRLKNVDGIEKVSIRNAQQKDKVFSNTISDKLEEKMKAILSEVLGVQANMINVEESFVAYGMDSIYLTEIIKRMEKELSVSLEPAMFLEHDNIRALCRELGDDALDFPEKIPNDNLEFGNSEGSNCIKGGKFAIVGASCRFPGANNLDEFWCNLRNGVSSISEVPKDRFDISKVYSTKTEKGKTIGKWGGFIENIEYFDPEFFGISREEAMYTDPMIRLSLENSMSALLNAGYNMAEIKGKNVGVFMGARVGEFSQLFPKENTGKITGVGQNFCAAYLSQFFDIKGPAMVIDTACSSSLVSLKEACNHILLGECDMAIVGGVDTIINEKTYLLLSDALSPDGKCYTFDEKANGFVPGEGCGVVIVKALEQAVRDKDNIIAVIEGIEVNNDGKTMGITTPSLQGQMDVIRKALTKAQIKPEEISYIEAHGTGTLIGDPIELKALTNVYREFTNAKQFCYVGSVKTNIGHLLSASGIASLIKVMLCINKKELPPTLNCDTPNPRFKFDISPFKPILQTEKWEGRRKAGISSFGFGGTNVHLILSSFDGYNSQKSVLPEPEYNKDYYWPIQKMNCDEAMEEKKESNEFGFVRF